MDPEGNLGAGPGGATPPAAGPSAEEFERLRIENEQFRATFSRLDPYVDDIKRIVEDEGYRTYIREGSQYYDKLREQQKPALSPETQAVLDAIDQKTKPFLERVEREEQQRSAEVNARRQRAFDEGKPIVQAHVQRNPELAQSKVFARALEAMQDEAVERNVPFKDVWDGFMGTAGAAAARQAPPRQMRANAGEQGIPAAREQRASSEDSKGKSFKQIFLETHQRVNGKAS